MDKQQSALSTLAEAIGSLETLDLSFIFGETKRDVEYSLNEIIIDIEHIESIIEGDARQDKDTGV
jgi:hypothetical protein